MAVERGGQRYSHKGARREAGQKRAGKPARRDLAPVGLATSVGDKGRLFAKADAMPHVELQTESFIVNAAFDELGGGIRTNATPGFQERLDLRSRKGGCQMNSPVERRIGHDDGFGPLRGASNEWPEGLDAFVTFWRNWPLTLHHFMSYTPLIDGEGVAGEPDGSSLRVPFADFGTHLVVVLRRRLAGVFPVALPLGTRDAVWLHPVL